VVDAKGETKRKKKKEREREREKKREREFFENLKISARRR
jgi:hypothetical protein